MRILVGLRIQKLHFGLISLVKDLASFINLNERENFEVIFLIADLHSIIDQNLTEEFIKDLDENYNYLIEYLPKILKYYTKTKNYSIEIENQYNYEILELNFLVQNIVSYSEIYSIPNIAERHRTGKFTPISFYNYPILQYCDIIYHYPDIVFMGKDQTPIMKIFNKVLDRINETKIFKAVYKLKDFDFIPAPRIMYSDAYIVDIENKKIGGKININSSEKEINDFFNKMPSENRNLSIPCNRNNCLFIKNASKILDNLNHETHICKECKKHYIDKILDLVKAIKN